MGKFNNKFYIPMFILISIIANINKNFFDNFWDFFIFLARMGQDTEVAQFVSNNKKDPQHLFADKVIKIVRHNNNAYLAVKKIGENNFIFLIRRRDFSTILNGEIKVESTLHQGTRFIIDLKKHA